MLLIAVVIGEVLSLYLPESGIRFVGWYQENV